MKVVAEEQPVETVIEKAYFHIENGGLTLSIVEIKPGGGGTPNEYRFKHELSMHGQSVESSFPLGSSNIVGWMNMALQRVSMKVAGIHHDGRNLLPFDAPDIQVQNGVEIEKTASLLRIVAQFQRDATDFPSQEALQKYMKDHPGADPKNHSVKTDEKGNTHEKPKGTLEERAKAHGESKKEEKEEEKEEHEYIGWGALIKKSMKEKTLDRVKAMWKGGGAAAKAFPVVMKYIKTEAPKVVRDFLDKPEVGRRILMGAHDVLSKISKKTAEAVGDTFKRESHEFKEAYDGIKAAYNGKPMNEAQKNAVMGCCWDATVLLVGTCLGVGMAHGAAAAAHAGITKFVSGFAQKVAMNALVDELDDINIKDDLTELGEGLHHLYHFAKGVHEVTAAKKPEADDKAVMTAFVMQLVDRTMKKLTPDDLAEIYSNVALDKTIEKPKNSKKTAGAWTITSLGVVETV